MKEIEKFVADKLDEEISELIVFTDWHQFKTIDTIQVSIEIKSLLIQARQKAGVLKCKPINQEASQ
jgi:hypothetical protein